MCCPLYVVSTRRVPASTHAWAVYAAAAAALSGVLLCLCVEPSVCLSVHLSTVHAVAPSYTALVLSLV